MVHLLHFSKIRFAELINLKPCIIHHSAFVALSSHVCIWRFSQIYVQKPINKSYLILFFVWTDLQRRGLSVRPFLLQLWALRVHLHWHDVASRAHFLPLQGRQRGVGEGEGERVVGGDVDGRGEDMEGGGRGGAWVLCWKRGAKTSWLDADLKSSLIMKRLQPMQQLCAIQQRF